MAELILQKKPGACTRCHHPLRIVLSEGMLTCCNCGLVNRTSCFARAIPYHNEFLPENPVVGSHIMSAYIRGTNGASQQKRLKNVKLSCQLEYRWRMILSSSSERHLKTIFREIETVVARCAFGPQFGEQCKKMARVYVQGRKKIATRKTKVLAYVFVMLQARRRSTLPFSTLCGRKGEYISKRELGMYLKKISKEMQCKGAFPKIQCFAVRFAGKLRMDRLTIAHVRRFSHCVQRYRVVSNRNPISVVGGVLYISQWMLSDADTERWSFRTIANTVDVAEQTVLKCTQSIFLHKDVKHFCQRVMPPPRWKDVYNRVFTERENG
jgi:transcription initiation factor TFIIIB Brf1 subunit/transcription initiation factor TFIIB